MKVVSSYLKVPKHSRMIHIGYQGINGMRRTSALYKDDDRRDMCGMRVKHIWKFNGTG
jgi:hypothetical protein